LPHGRKTLPTPWQRVYKTTSNDDCSGHIRLQPNYSRKVFNKLTSCNLIRNTLAFCF